MKKFSMKKLDIFTINSTFKNDLIILFLACFPVSIYREYTFRYALNEYLSILFLIMCFRILYNFAYLYKKT